MRDIDIRRRLLDDLAASEGKDALIIEEFGLCRGTARVDVAVVNGSLNGYEIKSERDTLERLPAQQDVYDRVFDTVTIVCGSQHIAKITEQVSTWWGIWLAVEEDNVIRFKTIREAETNPCVDPMSLAQCLWRDEALSILKTFDLHKGLLSKPRMVLWQRLTEMLSAEELGECVRNHLKARDGWRSDAPPGSNGG